MSYQQTIYNMLRKAGMTEAGALGVLGNFECESNCEPIRLQGDFSPSRAISRDYVIKADSGQMTEAEFSKPIGFGIAQFTYPQRKINLWRFWKNYGSSLGNVQMQTEFVLKEFKTEYIPDWRLLCSTGDIYEATKAVCVRYENPAIHNIDARYQAALRIKGEIDLGEWEGSALPPEEPETPDQGWEQIPTTEFWPPRMLCYGMRGADVEVLVAVLFARGWTVDELTDRFDMDLEETVKAFQKAYGLDVDGIVGPKTWGELLKR